MNAPHPPRLAITGYGLATPLGVSAWNSFAALLARQTLADRAARLPDDTDLPSTVRALGSVTRAQLAAADPAIELAELAAREALTQARIDPLDHRAHLFLGASKGAVHALTAAAARTTGLRDPHRRGGLADRGPEDAHLAFALGPHGYLAHHLSHRLHIPLHSQHVAACASGLVALHHAAEQLRSRRLPGQTAVVVSAESALLPLFIHSYKRLGVLAGHSPQTYKGYPLDARRGGFMLAELSAAIVLQAVREPEPGQVELLDTAAAAEGYDMIRSSPTMPALDHIAGRMLGDRAIDLLHPHAPGTADHDATELGVLARHVDPLTDVYACKGALGHGLGAAGLVSLVVACLCARAKKRPPMPWLDQPIDAPLPLDRNSKPLPPQSTHAIFAAGFGGHTAGAVIRGV